MTLESAPNPVDVHVGARVRLRRKLLDLSQHQLADKLGLTFQQVQKYERGANRISASKLYEIACALGAPIAYFFEGLEDPASRDLDEARHAVDRRMAVFLASREALELARVFPRIRQALIRRRIVDLAAAVASDVVARAADGEGGERPSLARDAAAPGQRD